MDWLIRHTVYQRVTNSSVGRRCMRSGCGGSISLAFRSLSPPSFRNSSYGGFFSNKVVRFGPAMIFLASIRPLSEVPTDTRIQNSGFWGHRRSVNVLSMPSRINGDDHEAGVSQSTPSTFGRSTQWRNQYKIRVDHHTALGFLDNKSTANTVSVSSGDRLSCR
jgi:hypothetical protein